MKELFPPQRITDFLQWLCPAHLFEGIAGDLEEQFYADVEEHGPKRAKRRYWWNALRFMHPEILIRNKSKPNIINTIMFSNYLKIAGRNMAKRKLFSFINAFGLSIGIAFCILIYLFIQDEKRFDQFHVKKDNIYRIEEKAYDLWEPDPEEPYNYSAYLQTPLAPVMKEEIPQVKYATRFNPGGSGIVTYGEKVFTETLAFTDADFFKMFSFPLVAGNEEELLTDRYQVVITPEIAEKYFGTADAVGKVLKIDHWGENEFTVAGVITPPPANSSLQYGILLSQENRAYYEHNMNEWRNFSTPTFVLLEDNADMDAFKGNLQRMVDKYMKESLEGWRERYSPPEDIRLFEYQYTNLNDVHLNTQVSWDRSSDPQYSWILGGIAILILVIACINYISLSLTTSAARKTEVGVRKAIGAHRGQLINQFTIESVLLTLASTVIGILLMVAFLPAFNEFTHKQIMLSVPVLLEIVGKAVFLAIVVGVFSGCYPAFFLSAFKPSIVLKGGFTSKLKAGFTIPLVIIQFALSAFLIISSVIMYRQMEFVTTKDLGYDQEHILVVPTQMGWNRESNKAVERMRNRLRHEPGIVSVAGTSLSFNMGWSRNGYTIDGEHKSAYVYTVDPNYVETLNIKLKEGRNFDADILSDSNALIVNEALVNDMGWEDPLNEHLNWQEDSASLGYRIIGVAEDYHFRSLKTAIEPMFLNLGNGYLTNMLIKMEAGRLAGPVEKIERIWSGLFPDKPFDYSFLDDDVARQYESYKRWMSIMGLSTLFAILISCLGLFGLAGINALNRTKEIGIRKVFGAELTNIFILLNKQYVLLALIAFALAAPLSWYVMDKWLAGFEYGISMSWHIFAISMLAGMAIALITVSYHAIKTAFVNPADTLKYE